MTKKEKMIKVMKELNRKVDDGYKIVDWVNEGKKTIIYLKKGRKKENL